MNGDQLGQATVEAALVLPVVLMALLLIVQVGVVTRDALALAQAAREGARAAAISASEAAAAEAVRSASGPLEAERIVVEIEPSPSQGAVGSPITVKLSYEERLRIPVVSRIASLSLPLTASSTMRQERTAPPASPDPP